MSIVEYRGTEEEIRIQLGCDHEWHGPCIDWISRFYKCTKCFCVERDLTERQFKMERELSFTRVERVRKLIGKIAGKRRSDTAAIEKAMNIIDGIE